MSVFICIYRSIVFYLVVLIHLFGVCSHVIIFFLAGENHQICIMWFMTVSEFLYVQSSNYA